MILQCIRPSAHIPHSHFLCFFTGASTEFISGTKKLQSSRRYKVKRMEMLRALSDSPFPVSECFCPQPFPTLWLQVNGHLISFPKPQVPAWTNFTTSPKQETYLSLECLLNVGTQRAPLVCFLKGLSGKLHPGLHLIDFYQHLKGKGVKNQGSDCSIFSTSISDLKPECCGTLPSIRSSCARYTSHMAKCPVGAEQRWVSWKNQQKSSLSTWQNSELRLATHSGSEHLPNPRVDIQDKSQNTCIDWDVSCSNFLMSSLTRIICSFRKDASCLRASTSRSTLGMFWRAWWLVSVARTEIGIKGENRTSHQRTI